MNILRPEKIVVLGFLSHFPVPGVAWQTLHYLKGFQRLGYDVYYVEAHGCTPSKLMQSQTDDGGTRAAAYISEIMRRFDLGDRWAYHLIYESRCLGMSESQLKELYRSAAMILNLHGSHLPNEELTATNRLVYLGTDPVDIEIDVHRGSREAIEYLKPHCAFFTYGENLGLPDCLVPVPAPFKFLPTRQPVVMDYWDQNGSVESGTFTTIGNWRQPWREVKFQNETYRWSKHWEFLKFIDLPSKTQQPFELALSSYTAKDQQQLESHGWSVRPALDLSRNLDVYRDYITASRAEFTVAKDQNVRLRSGWFSDRAATYLAAGRPVLTQETGFSNILPTGEGLHTFSTMEEILTAVEATNSDYTRERRAAWRIAQEYFSHEVVLGQLLKDLGMKVPQHQAPRCQCPGLAPELILTPISRWPTRLADETLEAAQTLRPPQAIPLSPANSQTLSLVLVTHNGLPYTKMCLTNLLESGWNIGDELIVVDNASTDGTQDYLQELRRLNPFVQTVLNPDNRGFAAANNQALAVAGGDALVLLNNDTLVLPGWKESLLQRLKDPRVGLVGPVTNRTCNSAQIDAPYRTYKELKEFGRRRASQHAGESSDIAMLAMFCVAMRREVYEQVGPLDERFAMGMFEDDDYSRRIRASGYNILSAEDVFVHHFGQASFGELCNSGEYNRIFEGNRLKFEKKWGIQWKPHARRITPEYRQLRERIHETVVQTVPTGATVAVVSKGDPDLLQLEGRHGWHFPRSNDGAYANIYPADNREAIEHLEFLRNRGADYLLIPQPALWWLDYYAGFKSHLEQHYSLERREVETCLIFNLGGCHAA